MDRQPSPIEPPIGVEGRRQAQAELDRRRDGDQRRQHDARRSQRGRPPRRLLGPWGTIQDSAPLDCRRTSTDRRRADPPGRRPQTSTSRPSPLQRTWTLPSRSTPGIATMSWAQPREDSIVEPRTPADSSSGRASWRACFRASSLRPMPPMSGSLRRSGAKTELLLASCAPMMRVRHGPRWRTVFPPTRTAVSRLALSQTTRI